MTSNGKTNGKTEPKKKRPQSDLELATMKHCRRLIMRLNDGGAKQRILDYLGSAVFEGDEVEPPPVEDPRQTSLSDFNPASEDLPFT